MEFIKKHKIAFTLLGAVGVPVVIYYFYKRAQKQK